jgi:epsilon-lactone hydrolase
MPSLQSYFLHWYLLRLQRKNAKKNFTLAQERQIMNHLGSRVPMAKDAQIERVSALGIPCEWVSTPASLPNRVIMYLHGGAYTRGSLDSHRAMASKIAEICRARVLQVDYRLAPEFPFPAGLDDALTVYEWLTKQVDNQQVMLAGDSAGGGLALAALLKIKEDNLPTPAGAMLLCPWVDLEARSETLDSLATKDPILTKTRLLESVRQYCGKYPTENPFISPINADLSGLPPLLIHVATLDILSGEGTQLAQKTQSVGVKVEFEVWKNMIHVFHFVHHRLPEARRAIQKMAEFMDKYLPKGN